MARPRFSLVRFVAEKAKIFGWRNGRSKRPKIVDIAVLKERIIAINEAAKRDMAEHISAGCSVELLKHWLPRHEQRAARYHEPYSIAGIPYPYRMELRHILIVGDRQTGKTQLVYDLLSQVEKLDDSAVVFDRAGDFVARFYQESRDYILHPFDARCSAWAFFSDLSSEADFVVAAEILFPNPDNDPDALWPKVARALFVELCLDLHREGRPDNVGLAEGLRAISFEVIEGSLHAHSADRLTTFDIGAAEQTIRSVFEAVARPLYAMKHESHYFSIRHYITSNFDNGSILFICWHRCRQNPAGAFIPLWLHIALTALADAPKANVIQNWLLIDDLGVLPPLPGLPGAMEQARAHGGPIFLTVDSFEDLTRIYGEQTAGQIFARAENKLMLKAADDETASACAQEILGIERQNAVSEYLAAVRNSLATLDEFAPGDALTDPPSLSPTSLKQLTAFTGYLKFANGFPAAFATFEKHHFRARAQAFELSLKKLPWLESPPAQPKPPDPQPLPLAAPLNIRRPTVVIERGPAPGLGPDDHCEPRIAKLTDKQLDVTRWGSLREAPARLGLPQGDEEDAP
jgi:hypothetical protein